MQDFRNLDVWQRSHKLVMEIYKGSQQFPREEVFGVTMQLRRSASHIPSRLAAASAKPSGGDKASEVHKAISFASELEYAIVLASDLGYLAKTDAERFGSETVEIRKMLFGLLRTL